MKTKKEKVKDAIEKLCNTGTLHKENVISKRLIFMKDIVYVVYLLIVFLIISFIKNEIFLVFLLFLTLVGYPLIPKITSYLNQKEIEPIKEAYDSLNLEKEKKYLLELILIKNQNMKNTMVEGISKANSIFVGIFSVTTIYFALVHESLVRGNLYFYTILIIILCFYIVLVDLLSNLFNKKGIFFLLLEQINLNSLINKE